MELLHATYVTHEFAPHFHEFFAVGLIERGEYTYRYRGSSRYIGSGQIVIINPGEVHTGRATTASGWTYRMFYPDITFIRSLAIETGDTTDSITFPETVIDNPEAAALILRAHQASEEGDSLAYNVTLREAFGNLIIRYRERSRRKKPRSEPPPRAIKRVIEYMNEYAHQPLSLDDLATVAGFSSYYLIRLFRKHTGLSPHTYLMNLRVQLVGNLLKNGKTIAEAAVEGGFTDQSHLNRWFKRFFGFTPGAYVRGLDT